MPIIDVELFEGRTIEQKRRLVKTMTEAVVQSLEVKPDDVRREIEPWNVAGLLDPVRRNAFDVRRDDLVTFHVDGVLGSGGERRGVSERHRDQVGGDVDDGRDGEADHGRETR